MFFDRNTNTGTSSDVGFRWACRLLTISKEHKLLESAISVRCLAPSSFLHIKGLVTLVLMSTGGRLL